MKRVILIIAGFFCLVFLIWHFHLFLFEEYLIILKKDGGVYHENQQGRVDGEALLFKHGQLEKKGFFVDGLKEGWATEYYENGNLRRKAFYKSNIGQDSEYYYYNTGKLKYRSGVFDGKTYGSLFWYTENGQLDYYAAFDVTGNSFYLVKYGSTGKITNVKGPIVSPIIYTINSSSDSIITLNQNNKHSDINDLYITVAQPPDAHRTFEVVINGRTFTPLVKNNTIKIVNAFTTKGLYRIVVGNKKDASWGNKPNEAYLVTFVEKD